MKKLTLFAAGAWALGLLTGLYAWLSPDSAFFPGPYLALAVMAGALVLLVVGAVVASWPLGGSRSSFAASLAAIAPLVGAALALIFAARGFLPHPALPLLFLVICGLGAAGWARGRSADPMTWIGDLGIGLLMITSLTIVLPALLLGAMGQVLWGVATPRFDRSVARIHVTDAVVPFRPVPWAGIDAEAAGIALQAVAAAGNPRRDPLLVDLPAAPTAKWLPDSGPFEGWSGDSLMRHALRGLTREERSWLMGLSPHPGLPLLDTIAYAVRLDPWAAIKLPLPPRVSVWNLPIPSIVVVRAAARSQLYRAALAMADHHPAVADSLIRQVIGLGLRLRDDSDLLLGTLIGSTIAREGGLTLAATWAGTARAAEGQALVAALAYPPDLGIGAEPDLSSSPAQVRARLLAGANDGAIGRSMRLEYLSTLGVGPCTNLRELLYGPTPIVREAFRSAAPLYERSANERAIYDRLSLGIMPMLGDPAVSLVYRPAAAAFGQRPLAACSQVMFGARAD